MELKPKIQIRPFRWEDLPALVELINEADAHDRRERGTSLRELEEEFREPGFAPEENVFLVELEPGEKLVGYGALALRLGGEADSFFVWGVVHPEFRRRGIGTRLMERLLARARERLPETKTKKVYFQAGCEPDEHDRIKLFEKFGLRPVRYFFEMVRDLREPLPEVKLPEGFRLRTFVKGQDERRWLAALNEAFADHWDHRPWPEEEFLYWVNTKWFQPELSLIAETEEGEIAGICHNAIDEEDIARIGRKEGWAEMLAVRRPYRGRGLGKALLAKSLHLLRERGMDYAALGVDSENPTGALRLYEGLGFRVRKRYVRYRREL